LKDQILATVEAGNVTYRKTDDSFFRVIRQVGTSLEEEIDEEYYNAGRYYKKCDTLEALSQKDKAQRHQF
jgi:hypothetical protein